MTLLGQVVLIQDLNKLKAVNGWMNPFYGRDLSDRKLLAQFAKWAEWALAREAAASPWCLAPRPVSVDAVKPWNRPPAVPVVPPPPRRERELCQLCELVVEELCPVGWCRHCALSVNQPEVVKAQAEADFPPYRLPWWVRIVRLLARL